jgi:hypothetical protein
MYAGLSDASPCWLCLIHNVDEKASTRQSLRVDGREIMSCAETIPRIRLHEAKSQRSAVEASPSQGIDGKSSCAQSRPLKSLCDIAHSWVASLGICGHVVE